MHSNTALIASNAIHTSCRVDATGSASSQNDADAAIQRRQQPDELECYDATQRHSHDPGQPAVDTASHNQQQGHIEHELDMNENTKRVSPDIQRRTRRQCRCHEFGGCDQERRARAKNTKLFLCGPLLHQRRSGGIQVHAFQLGLSGEDAHVLVERLLFRGTAHFIRNLVGHGFER